MTTVLVFVMWLGGNAATSFVQEFETHAACADARDGIATDLSKDRRLTFSAECYPKGETKL